MLMSSNLIPDGQERDVRDSSLAQLLTGLWWSKQSVQSSVQENNAVEWQLLLYKSNCIYSKNSVICAAYFVSKAEEKMKGNEGISCSRLKMSFIFQSRIQQLRGNGFFFFFYYWEVENSSY